jgi:hypothetical protein
MLLTSSINKRNPIMRRFFPGVFYSLAFVLLILGGGCSTAKSWYDGTTDPIGTIRHDSGKDKSGLKKKVLVLPILNQAGLPEKRLGEITSMLHSLLEKDSNFFLEKPAEPLPSTVTMRSPRYGIVTDTDAAKRAEEMAANVLLTVIMNSPEMRLKRTGIWPLRWLKREVEISMTVSALDLTNGTLFLSRVESERLDFKMEDSEDEDEIPKKPEMPEIDDKTFTRTMSRIIDRQASAVRGALRSLPWSGRILSSDGKRIIISAGNKAGVGKERIFEVFTRGEQVRSAGGGSVYLLGPKVGEVKTTEVMEDFAAAQPLQSAEYKAGQVIRAKK